MKRKKMKKTLKKIPPELTMKMIIDYDLEHAGRQLVQELMELKSKQRQNSSDALTTLPYYIKE